MMSENRRNLRPEEIAENKEDITLIWLDQNIDDSNDSQDTQTTFKQLNNYVQFYTDPLLCIDYIRTIKDELIFLVVSGSLSKQILPHICCLPSVHSIFIFCINRNDYLFLQNDYPKIVDIFIDQESLFKSVRNTLHRVSKQTVAFSLFDQKNQKSIRDLSKDSASFLWYQLLIDILKQMPHTEQAKQEMLDKCSDYYRTNSCFLEKIELFRSTYTCDRAIEWFTEDSFVYRLLNKALRTEDVDLLYLFRYFIIDLCNQLELVNRIIQNATTTREEILTLYRGQQISTQEFQKLNEGVGILISTNGFFSTTRDINVALDFVAGTFDTDELKVILFEIKVDCRLKNVTFGDINKYSKMKCEQEVLFSLGAVFKIDEVQYDTNLQLFKIKMTATDDGSKGAEEYLNYVRRQLDNYTPTILFGRLLWNEMGQLMKAEKYFHTLLKTLPNDHEDLSAVYNQLGNVYYRKGEVDLALENSLRAFELRQKLLPSDHPHLAGSLNNLGGIYLLKGDLGKAMTCCTQVLVMNEKNYPNDHVCKTNTLATIGLIYKAERQYDAALDFMKKAFQMRKRLLPDSHPLIADGLYKIASVYENKLDYKNSLDYYHQAFEMMEKALPNDHEHLLRTLSDIVRVYANVSEYNIALQFCKSKLHLRRRSYTTSENHLHKLAQTFKNMGDSFNGALESLDFYSLALDILQNSDHPITIECHRGMSVAYFNQNMLDDCLSHRLKSLEIEQKLYVSNPIRSAESLHDIGKIYIEIRNYSQALTYLTKGLEIFEANYTTMKEYETMKTIRNDIVTVTEKLKMLSTIKCI
ncbi:unnamed protein product [Didymodactylos carnosus]|uniref:NAD(P)(+)--arginine ADP-ribosyltransferase n=1 Tax=Didymodactylos carnosus TaxID=1234261 RepID=A0A814EM89_9BILA|nr:unnamed protein product [Didymodactylos carnosus]CAF1120661.1 unnamed protein product [Didymodactylos carnosus]CAF3744215.1 unnamed protein product [Didymodactylos carnosus]CAF3894450.1 unnamed protein product [Didymodactylos carnosus]